MILSGHPHVAVLCFPLAASADHALVVNSSADVDSAGLAEHSSMPAGSGVFSQSANPLLHEVESRNTHIHGLRMCRSVSHAPTTNPPGHMQMIEENMFPVAHLSHSSRSAHFEVTAKQLHENLVADGPTGHFGPGFATPLGHQKEDGAEEASGSDQAYSPEFDTFARGPPNSGGYIAGLEPGSCHHTGFG